MKLSNILQIIESGPTITGMYAPTNGLLRPEFPIPTSEPTEENVPPTPSVDKAKLFGNKVRRKLHPRQRARLHTLLKQSA